MGKGRCCLSNTHVGEHLFCELPHRSRHIRRSPWLPRRDQLVLLQYWVLGHVFEVEQSVRLRVPRKEEKSKSVDRRLFRRLAPLCALGRARTRFRALVRDDGRRIATTAPRLYTKSQKVSVAERTNIVPSTIIFHPKLRCLDSSRSRRDMSLYAAGNNYVQMPGRE